MKLLPGSNELGSNSRQERGLGRAMALPLLAVLAVSVSGCISPVDNLNGFLIELFGFIILCFVVSIFGVRLLLGSLGATTTPIKGGIPGEAVIETIADTGFTMSSPGVGPNAPRYQLGLLVTPAGGGAPYQVQVKAFIPRIYAPMIVPGARVGVQIDPNDPTKVHVDFSRMGGSSDAGSDASSGAASGPSFGPGGMNFQFDANGNPVDGEVSSLVGAVRSGSLPTINSGPAERLLATGTHGTAVITSAQPMGKTVRDINPNADPSRLNDPMWVFTVEVTVAGESPFPAVFGHRVPIAKVASVFPGAKLAIAVNMSDKHNEVAIDWDKSPLGS